MVCIVHGWLPYENRVNGLGIPGSQIKGYERFTGRCSGIAAVSKLQASFVAAEAPNLAGKMDWFFNGVERWKPIVHVSEGRLVVSVSGGTRPIKRNEIVAAACDLIREQGVEVELRVYGRNYAGDKSWRLAPGIRYMGQVEQHEFLQGLAETDVFVIASLHESFGLSAIDALRAGASLLVSDACGVNDTIALQDSDIVCNEATAEEIAEGILRLWHRPNAERLAASIDYERHSWDAAARRVRDICAGSLN